MLKIRRVKVELTVEQMSRVRKEVFADIRLSGGQRRSVIGRIVPLPHDGSRVVLSFEGAFVGEV